MNKLKNIWALSILVIFLTVTTIQNDTNSTIMVQGSVSPTHESDIVIGIDMAHNNNISAAQLTNLTTYFNNTFSTTQIVFLDESVNSDKLSEIDVLVVLSPTSSYSDSEINDVENFIKTGNSLLVATGYRNQNTEPSNSILSPFGVSFNLSSSIIPEHVRIDQNLTINYTYLARNFTTPITPITEDISRIIYPNGLGISFNYSYLESYKSPQITYFNPVLLMDAVTDPSENNTLASTLEFENGARILTIGSVDMFNNSYIEPLENTTVNFFDNTDFLMNSIRWLGRNTGIMNFHNPWTNRHTQSIDLGEVVKGNVTLMDSSNHSLTQSQIYIALERTGSILRSRILDQDTTNLTKYFGRVNTEGLSSGYCDIIFMASRIGYLPIEVTAGRIFLKSPFPSPIPPNFALWGLLVAVIILFSSSVFFIRLNLKET